MKNYSLEKWEWTEKDFEKMGWHDCPIYAFRFDDKVSFDLDYILMWNNPEIEGMSYTFWISPSTLIFENVTFFKVGFEMDFVNGLEISDIEMEKTDGLTIWKIETQEGTIIIHSNSFKQIIRRKPTLQFGQCINNYERGEVNFSENPEKDFKYSEQVNKIRNTEFELFELSKERYILSNKLNNLDKGKITTKEYLIEKRELESGIEKLNNRLQNTRFEN